MRNGVKSLLIMLIVAYLSMVLIGNQFPEFATQLGTFFTYFAFIGIVVLLITGRKR